MDLNFSPQIVKVRRDYNQWVATETLEDYALRFAPKSFRKWPSWLVANTAIGGISFLALEAIGGSLMLTYGFANTFWAIVVVGIIIFLVSLPISYYAAKYNIDMDLLTRGAGFGYIGSTITSLIYASFTFIFLALEATIMAQAIELYWHWNLSLTYLVCSLLIVPLVFFGVTLINPIQLWTQFVGLILLVLPYIVVLYKDPDAWSEWVNLGGELVNICSLCCTLESRCHDRCKKTKLEHQEPDNKDKKALADSWGNRFSKLIRVKIAPQFGFRLLKFFCIFLLTSAIIGFFFWVVYYQQMERIPSNALITLDNLRILLLKLYASLSIFNGVGIWWLILTLESWQLEEEELDKQNLQLQTEIQERKQVENALRESEAQLRYDAFHDCLTGLANRALFMEKLDYALKRGQRHQENLCAVLFLDLDRFKVINDSLGHLMGDQLLIQLAQRLKTNQRIGDLIARLGGDEFVILLQDITSPGDAIYAAQRIQQLLVSAFKLGSHEIVISTSIGIALNSKDNNTPSQLLRAADTALYHAKEQGKNCYALFDDSMHTESLRRLSLESDLRQALEHQELVVYYQPIIKLDTNWLEGVEALVRWRHPKLGLVMPNEFIPLAEETGLIIELDRWVLYTACLQMAQWKEQFPTTPLKTVSVNLSPKHWAQPDLIAYLDQMLTETGLEGQQLKLEITETVLLTDPQAMTNLLIQLKERGIQICLDDFGTGYSSLSYLHRFPIDIVKLDRTFVGDLVDEKKNAAIMRTIGTLGKELNLELIAEGIETLEQRDLLKGFGYKWGQGYWYSPPVESTDLTVKGW